MAPAQAPIPQATTRAYRLGYKANLMGLHRGFVPYLFNADLRREWLRGWEDAQKQGALDLGDKTPAAAS
jgi:ribosome modulation factor